MDVRALDYGEENVGKRVPNSKIKFTWVLEMGGKQHTIELYSSVLSGRIKVVHNGKTAFDEITRFKGQFSFPFTIDGNMINIQEVTSSIFFELRVNNVPFHRMMSTAGRPTGRTAYGDTAFNAPRNLTNDRNERNNINDWENSNNQAGSYRDDWGQKNNNRWSDSNNGSKAWNDLPNNYSQTAKASEKKKIDFDDLSWKKKEKEPEIWQKNNADSHFADFKQNSPSPPKIIDSFANFGAPIAGQQSKFSFDDFGNHPQPSTAKNAPSGSTFDNFGDFGAALPKEDKFYEIASATVTVGKHNVSKDLLDLEGPSPFLPDSHHKLSGNIAPQQHSQQDLFQPPTQPQRAVGATPLMPLAGHTPMMPMSTNTSVPHVPHQASAPNIQNPVQPVQISNIASPHSAQMPHMHPSHQAFNPMGQMGQVNQMGQMNQMDFMQAQQQMQYQQMMMQQQQQQMFGGGMMRGVSHSMSAIPSQQQMQLNQMQMGGMYGGMQPTNLDFPSRNQGPQQPQSAGAGKATIKMNLDNPSWPTSMAPNAGAEASNKHDPFGFVNDQLSKADQLNAIRANELQQMKQPPRSVTTKNNDMI